MSSQKRRRRRKARNLCQLEPLVRGVQVTLTHDLKANNFGPSYQRRTRGQDLVINTNCPPYMFKKLRQCLDFDKRVIWTTDRSFSELSEEAFKAFRISQDSFCLPEPMSLRVYRVLIEASRIAHSILGEFSYDKWLDSCAFGKRAAVNLPRREAYLDTRFERISGTAKQRSWFNESLARDIHLFRAVRKRSRSRRESGPVKVTSVPKSFKSARVIAPDTILGGYLSRGLGDYIRERLEKETHIDLSLQQERHRRWAKVASISGHLSTIDMSKASDSFVWNHLKYVLPKSWLHALDVVRAREVQLPDGMLKLNSVMLMGSGHTFPLQTLLFYCFAEATRTLLKSRGKVSVYGDDIIVPTRISRRFIVVMSEMGFSINSEKSFYDSPDPERPSHTFFRESCGGDYKGGIDVRPYMPECDLQSDGQVPRNEYVAWCHRMINGLLTRWTCEEIPMTVAFLLREIHDRTGKVCFVPSWETDHAGIKHYIPSYLTVGLEISHIKYVRSHPVYWKLTYERKKRSRNSDERPYLWYAYYIKRTDGPFGGNALITVGGLLGPNQDTEHDSYSSPVSLSGEPKRSEKGVYRWREFSDRPSKSRKRPVNRQTRESESSHRNFVTLTSAEKMRHGR